MRTPPSGPEGVLETVARRAYDSVHEQIGPFNGNTLPQLSGCHSRPMADDFKPGCCLEVGESDTPLHRMAARLLSPGTRRRLVVDLSQVSRKGPTNRKASSMALIHDTDWDSQHVTRLMA